MIKTDVFEEASLSRIIDGVVKRHRELLQFALPTLKERIDAAATASPSTLRADVEEAFRNLRGVLERHIEHEDQVVFCLIKSLEEAETLHVFHCKSIGRPIGVMVHEHKNVWAAMDRLRNFVDEYALETGPSDTVEEIVRSVDALERDMRSCFETEEQEVFPRAVAREALLAGRTA